MFVKWLIDLGLTNVDKYGVTFVKIVRKVDGSLSKILLSIHVDDELAACSDEAMYKEFIDSMSKDFDLNDSGELRWFLGGKVKQDREKVIVRLSQERYCSDVLKRFQMDNARLSILHVRQICTWQHQIVRHWIRDMWKWCTTISTSLERACI